MVRVRTSGHIVQRVPVLLQQRPGHSNNGQRVVSRGHDVSPVCAPVGHRELDLAGPLPLEQQPGGGVELLVAHVGCLGQLPGLGLDKLLVTIPEIIANFIKNDEILNKLISSGACTTSVIFCVFSK